MAQTFHPIAAVNVTPADSIWRDVECAAYIPVGATGVVLKCYITGANSRTLYIRKKGSTDEIGGSYPPESLHWQAIGVDGSRIFQGKVQNDSDTRVVLVGYTTEGVTFFDNGVVKTTASADTWLDFDLASLCPSAVGVIIIVAPGYNMGFRKKGSSDDRVGTNGRGGVIVGCDASQSIQSKSVGTTRSFYVIGYITSGATFNTNAVDMSLGTAGEDLDLDQLPATAVMGFFEAYNPAGTTYKYKMLPKGGTGYGDTQYRKVGGYGESIAGAFVPTDVNRYITAQIENLVVDFFLIGYAVEIIPLVADFSADITEEAVPFEVQFTDATAGGVEPYSYTWDFGDGSPVNHEQNPKHTYYDAGYYTVKLTVTDDASGEDDEEKVNYIFAKPAEVLIRISRADKSPAVLENWEDVDCSSEISADATGVLLHIVNTSATEYEYGIRKNGSTDTVKAKIAAGAQNWVFIGVDAAQKFEAYIETASLKIYLIGYTLYGVAFLANMVDKTPGSTGWQDIDCSGQVEHSPKGLIFMVKNITADALRAYGLRKNGSTDAFTEGAAGYLNIAAGNAHFVMIGCDNDSISEFQLSVAGDVKLYLIGYVFGGMTFFTNAIDKSPTVFGSYADIDISGDAATSSWAIVQVNCSDKAARYASLRYKGLDEDEYHKITYGSWKPQHLSSAHIFEAKVEDTNVDFFVVGYVIQSQLSYLTIDGIVKLGSNVVVGAKVICVNLTKGVYVGMATTDALGEYTFADAGYQFEQFLIACHFISGSSRYGECKQLELEE